MWVPSSTDALLARLLAGDLEETAVFDGKRTVPGNAELAVDVAAMTVNGGVLIFGVDENEARTRLTEPTPIKLSGMRERIDQVVSAWISERPEVAITALPAAADDEDHGFIVVVVPPSPRAPHQIVGKGKYQGRFYTRDATGNRILLQSEIEALYARRARWEHDVDAELESALERAMPTMGPHDVCLGLLTEPVLPAGPMLVSSARGDPVLQLRSAVEQALSAYQGLWDVGGNFPLLAGSWKRLHADAWHAEVGYEDEQLPNLTVTAERSGRLLVTSRRVGREHPQAPGHTLLYETSVAAITTRALALAGQIYRHAEYSGLVDVAVRLTPVRGVHSAGYRGDGYEMAPAYGADDYQRHKRPLASVLTDAPIDLARELLSDLFEATAGRGYDAFSPR